MHYLLWSLTEGAVSDLCSSTCDILNSGHIFRDHPITLKTKRNILFSI